jgi:hypothetical protein
MFDGPMDRSLMVHAGLEHFEWRSIHIHSVCPREEDRRCVRGGEAMVVGRRFARQLCEL